MPEIIRCLKRYLAWEVFVALRAHPMEGPNRRLASSPYQQRPTEAVNEVIKRIKRVAFGLRRCRNHRIRELLYAGRPN